MKNIFLTLTFLVSLNAGAIALSGTDPNDQMNRSTGNSRSTTVGTTTAQALDCPACRALERKTRGATGAQTQSIADALNPNLGPAGRSAFVPGLTPLRQSTPSGGQDQDGSANTSK